MVRSALVLAIGCGQPQAPASETLYKIRALYAGVSYFRGSAGRLPSSLSEVCDTNPRWCRLEPSDRWTRDWGTSILYRPVGNEYVLVSAGRDLRFATSDDLTLDSGLDRQWAELMAGCYTLSRRIRGAPWQSFRLSTEMTVSGAYRLEQPNKPTTDSAQRVEWYPIRSDSAMFRWIRIDRGTILGARATDGGFEIRAGGTSVAARKGLC
jgi:hypothetical protein